MSFGSLLHISSAKKNPLVLECLLCRDKFTEDAVLKKLYFLETCICSNCYKKATKVSPRVWCFAKRQTRSSPGFSEENDSCMLLCPDRVPCKLFIAKQTKEK